MRTENEVNWTIDNTFLWVLKVKACRHMGYLKICDTAMSSLLPLLKKGCYPEMFKNISNLGLKKNQSSFSCVEEGYILNRIHDWSSWNDIAESTCFSKKMEKVIWGQWSETFSLVWISCLH